MRHWPTRIMAVLAASLLIACTLFSCAAAENAYNKFLKTRVYDGTTYAARPAAELTTLLLIGYDHYDDGFPHELHGYSNGGQSDFMLLMVMDHKAKTIRMLQIDRDAMVGVRVTDVSGIQYPARRLQICLSHAYGATREENNENTIWSVERLLQIEDSNDGAQIDEYIAMDISGISLLNDLLGGVTVTVPYDMTGKDPALTAGATLTLNGEQAEIFCRGRSGVGDQTNASRMARQRIYLDAAGKRLREMLHEDANAGNKLLEGLGVIYHHRVDSDNPFLDKSDWTPVGDDGGKYLMSSMTLGDIVNLMLKIMDYEALPIETLPGTHSIGSKGYMEFDVETDAAVKWALSTFYYEYD